MSDFDFEELDRAVTGALGSSTPNINEDESSSRSVPVQVSGVRSSSPVSSPATRSMRDPSMLRTPRPTSGPSHASTKVGVGGSQSVSAGVSSMAADRPTVTSPKQSSAGQAVPVGAPAQRRSGGRVMDVMRPASMARTRPVLQAPAMDRTQAPQTIRPITPAPADPIDAPVVGTHSQSVEADTAWEAVEQESAADYSMTFEGDWQAPLDSPFIPNAQVEKRPLGTSAPTGSVSMSLDDLEAQLMLEEPDELRLEGPDELQLEAPGALQIGADVHEMSELAEPVLVAAPEVVISDDDGASPVIDMASEVPSSSADEPMVSSYNSAAIQSSAHENDLSRAAALDAENSQSGPVSITQQYTEKEPDATEPGSIYDTENYHQPITAPVKKKSGGTAILWTLLVLVLGAGAGAVFYFYVFPNL